MKINRDIYLNRLIQRKGNGLIKVITGIRRCGKSFLLFNLFKNYLLQEGVNKDHIIELNFDSYENEEYQIADKAYNYIKNKIIDSDMYYILLDEVQLLEKFESILNSFLRLPNVDIYVTGSNAKFLSKDVITEFRGRGDQVHIYPLSFKEYYSASNKDISKSFDDYIFYGGLPLILSMETHEQKANFVKNLYIETYLKDIISRNNIINDEAVQEIVNIISSSIGSLTNPNKLYNTFRSKKNSTLSSPTISKFLDYLVDSFLINRALRYDLKGKQYIGTPSKFYFTDLGIRNAAINFRQTERTHLLENLIYNELLIRGYSVDVGIISIVNRNNNNFVVRNNYEVDFVCNLVDKRIYIQSAYSIADFDKYNQEVKPFLNIHDSFKKIIITNDSTNKHYTDDGVLILNIFDFLLNPESMDY